MVIPCGRLHECLQVSGSYLLECTWSGFVIKETLSLARQKLYKSAELTCKMNVIFRFYAWPWADVICVIFECVSLLILSIRYMCQQQVPTVGLYLHINSYSSSADVIDPYHDLLDSMVHGANMGPIWGRQDPDGPQVGHKYLTIWVAWKFDGMLKNCPNMTSCSSDMFHGTGHQSTKISCRIIKYWMNCTSIIPDLFISYKYQSWSDYAKMANNGNFKQWIKCILWCYASSCQTEIWYPSRFHCYNTDAW